MYAQEHRYREIITKNEVELQMLNEFIRLVNLLPIKLLLRCSAASMQGQSLNIVVGKMKDTGDFFVSVLNPLQTIGVYGHHIAFRFEKQQVSKWERFKISFGKEKLQRDAQNRISKMLESLHFKKAYLERELKVLRHKLDKDMSADEHQRMALFSAASTNLKREMALRKLELEEQSLLRQTFG